MVTILSIAYLIIVPLISQLIFGKESLPIASIFGFLSLVLFFLMAMKSAYKHECTYKELEDAIISRSKLPNILKKSEVDTVKSGLCPFCFAKLELIRGRKTIPEYKIGLYTFIKEKIIEHGTIICPSGCNIGEASDPIFPKYQHCKNPEIRKYCLETCWGNYGDDGACDE